MKFYPSQARKLDKVCYDQLRSWWYPVTEEVALEFSTDLLDQALLAEIDDEIQ